MSGQMDKLEGFLPQEVERICASGALGRSPVYGRLLRYLAERTLAGSLPREIDIAIDVLDREEFDPSEDSSVRVYMYKLRQRLDAWYGGPASGQPTRIRLPRGEYCLRVDGNLPEHSETGRGARLRLAFAALAALAALGGYLAATLTAPPPPPQRDLAATELWKPITHGSQPLIVAVGDYFMFGEIGRTGSVQRLIRDFSVNSGEDLIATYGSGENDTFYADVRLSYLPLGVGAALADVLDVVRAGGREVVILPTSRLDAKAVQSRDILYIGYLSGLRLLQNFVFSTSEFELGSTFDELVSSDGKNVYISEAGFPEAAFTGYVDYGFLSTFPGPDGNQIMVIAGMRDEALMQMAATLTSEASVERLLRGFSPVSAPLSVEAVYRVRSMDRTNMDANLVFAGRLDHGAIWTLWERTRLGSVGTAHSVE